MSSKKLKLLAAAAVLAGGVTLADAEQVDLDSGLRAYWPMHGDLLEQVNPPRHIDLSGNGLNMKFGSGTVALPDAQAPDMQYLHLNGIAGQSSLYVPINKITLNNAAGVTVFFRIRGAGTAAEAADGAAAVVFEVSADHNVRAGAICILIVKKSDGWHIFPSAKTASAYAQAYAANPLRADEWTNVAVQYLKDDYPNCIRIFMDGVEQTLVEDDKQRASLKGVTFCNDVVNIGGRNQAKSLVGKMDIDEVGVYGRVLNDAEIVALSKRMSATNGTVSVSQKVSVLAQPNVTPALGVTSGYAKGDVVPIMWPDAGEQLLAWTLETNATDASGWLPWKRGFGAYGQFVHTGERVQVEWNPGAIAESLRYGWIFGDDPGTEIYGTGNNLTIGSNVEKKVDVRIVCATNRDLRKMVDEKKFREDLYYRLNVISIVLPPLRERIGDIEDLIRHFVDLFGGGLITVSEEAMKRLCQYRWPGNVRELRNVTERIVTLAEGEVIQVSDLPPEIVDAESQEPEKAEVQVPSAEAGRTGTLEEQEIAYIQQVLDNCGGNVSDAARVLDIGRSTLNAKIQKYGLRVSR